MSSESSDIRVGDGGQIVLTINNKLYTVGHDVPVDTSLNTFIRQYAHLPGTKYMCNEGGCGSCVVTVRSTHPVTKIESVYSVNSCLAPVLAMHRRSVTTVEGISGKAIGYNEVSARLAKFSGTQCGYCSPGMVMNMNSLLQSNKEITMAEVEDSFGGNICRCTGYRPILDAFKSLASDASKHLTEKALDIEDLQICSKTNRNCQKNCTDCIKRIDDKQDESQDFIELALGASKLKLTDPVTHALWFQVSTIQEIFEVFFATGSKPYMLVAGNTAQGIYRNEKPPLVYIDVNQVAELRTHKVNSDHVEFGAGIPLAELLTLLTAISKENPLMYGYFQQMADHLKLVATVPVRNIGTIAGNLMIKYQHNEFQSDIFLLFEAVHGFISLVDPNGVEKAMTLPQFLQCDMNQRVIKKLIIPALSSNHYNFKSYKIMPRATNAIAAVNAAFLFRVDPATSTVIEPPSMVFGAINPNFYHASRTEQYLLGKKLSDPKVVKKAFDTLHAELRPDEEPPAFSPKYRQLLATSLFYRYLLSMRPKNISHKLINGGSNLSRPISSGKQVYNTDKSVWPVNQPILKVDGLIQCAGEAQYVNDIRPSADELYGALVLANEAVADISIDSSVALKLPGVNGFFTVKDLPGKNSLGPLIPNLVIEDEPLFADGRALYSGQVVGIIVANSEELARHAATLVCITYTNKTNPILTVDEALKSGDTNRFVNQGKIEPTKTGTDVAFKINGRFEMPSQIHYHIEPQTARVVPVEDGLKVYAPAQSQALLQSGISTILSMPHANIEIETRRAGGAYGAKISRIMFTALPCALAAYKLNRPVRMVCQMEANFESVGTRYPTLVEYEVGVNNDGKIQYLNEKLYSDAGLTLNDPIFFNILDMFSNVYDKASFSLDIISVKTDKPTSSWVRAPGSFECVTAMEYIMEHIAYVVKKDPIQVRLVNMLDPNLQKYITDFRTSTSYDERLQEVNKFNQENRWKKRGIALLPMQFTLAPQGGYYATVSIYAADGTIGITHGGTEIGQGIYTKVAQVAAYTLGVDISKIKYRPTMDITSPNNGPTGASWASETTCQAVIKCCEQINTNLAPIKQQYPGAPLPEIFGAAFLAGVPLSASYMWSPNESVPKPYPINGVTVLEIEIDVLTGQHLIRRADITEDTGRSLSPEVDIGQIEGAFIMGLGCLTSEKLVYDPDTGRLLTNRTLNYEVPTARDIPVDFRVTLRQNGDNPTGVLRSKATGEPPLCMSGVIIMAVKNALRSARSDAGIKDEWFDLYPPLTIENILLNSGTSYKLFTY